MRWPETGRKTGKDRVPGRESARAESTGQELREDPLEEETPPAPCSLLPGESPGPRRRGAADHAVAVGGD